MNSRISRCAQAISACVRALPVRPSGYRSQRRCLVLFVLLALSAGTAVSLARVEAVPAGAALRLGDRTVSIAQLDQRIRLLAALYGISAPKDPAGLDAFRRDSAKAIVISDVLEEAAQARGIIIADKTANDALTDLVDKTYPQGRDVFDQKLAAVGVSSIQVVGELKRQLTDARLFDQVTGNVTPVTDADVAQVYQRRRGEMVEPERRHLRNIVVASHDEAERLATRLGGGADFATLAAQTSSDDSRKPTESDLGVVTRAQLESSYGDAAFGAVPTSVFGPVQTSYGWCVGQVLDVTPAVPLTLDQVREPLRASELRQRRQDTWDSWLNGQLESAHPNYADAYRPTRPDTVDPSSTPPN